MSAEQRFTEGIATRMGADVGLLSRPGTTAVADATRADSRRVAWYQIGQHTLMPCDPAIVSVVEELDDAERCLSDADFRSWVAEVGGTVLGQAVMKVVGPDGLQLVEPSGIVHTFDWGRPADIAMMQALVDGSSEDDLDNAEIAMDDLDDLALAVLDEAGEIQAYASSRLFEPELPFGDIAIMTSASNRKAGVGRSAVSALVRDLLVPAGIDPLYRCDPENLGSHRLSAALGFQVVVSLTVAELPTQ